MDLPNERCESCGQPMAAGLLEGYCPACLWRGLFVEKLTNAPPEGGETFASLKLPGLTVLGEIARGGMGIVYRAQQDAPEREVALKMLLPYQVATPAAKERFRAEAQAIASLDHPAILPVHQLGEWDGLPWFTMKLAAGGSLAERKQSFRQQWRLVAELLIRLGDAIQFAHERGILHRDIKPGNILFDEGGQAYISDFGLAKFLDEESDLSRSLALVGTPSYMAPELLEKQAGGVTTAADVYGLGAVLYELLYDRPPFVAGSLAAVLKSVSTEDPVFAVESGPRVPRDLEVICRTCLAKDPRKRYASARDLVTDLRRWREGKPILARPASLVEGVVSWAKRRPAVAALLILLVAGAITGSVVLAWQNRVLQRALTASRTAQVAERASLRAALLAQAQALGQTTQAGRKTTILGLLKTAAALEVEAEDSAVALRDAAVAALALGDLQAERRWILPLSLRDDSYFGAFAPGLDFYALSHRGGTELRGSRDQRVLARLPVEAHGGPQNVVFGADGQRIAVVAASGEASVWEWSTTNRLATLDPVEGAVTSLTFHPSGRSWAVARRDRAVEWRGERGERLASWAVTNAVAVAFSPDGGRLAIVGEQGVDVWTVTAPRRLWSLALAQPVHRVEWSADGHRLMAGSRYHHALYVLEAEGGAVQSHHAGHSRDPARFSFHPSGRLAASVGREGTLRLWDVRTGRDLVVLPATVEALRWSVDGRRLGYSPSLLEFGWLTFEEGKVFREFEESARTAVAPEDLLVTPDGRELVTVSSLGLRRWDAIGGRHVELMRLPGNGRTWGWISPDGRELIYGRRGEGGWRRERTNETAVARPLAIPANGLVADLQDAGDWLVASGQGDLQIWAGGNAARVRAVGSGLGGWRHDWSPDSRWIALSHRASGMVRMIDARQGQVVQELAVRFPAPRGPAPRTWFTPGGKRLLTSNGLHYQLWEVGTWKELRRWPMPEANALTGSAAISPDGNWAVLELAPDEFAWVSLETGKRIAVLRPPASLGAAAAVFSPDGASLFIAGVGPAVFEWRLRMLQAEMARLGLGW